MSFIFNYEHIQCVRTNYIIAVTCRLVDSLTCRLESVRDWSGILCEPCGDGIWERERGMGNGSRVRDLGRVRVSEQRYSGKPDGVSRNAQINA